MGTVNIIIEISYSCPARSEKKELDANLHLKSEKQLCHGVIQRQAL